MAGSRSLNTPSVIGDVVVGGDAGILQKSTGNGRLLVDGSAQPDIRSFFNTNPPGQIFFNQNLSQDKADALALSAQLAALLTGGMFDIKGNSTVVNGILLAPQRDIVIDNPPVFGSVIGSTIYIHSAASVTGCHCP
jgi:hypothetical protein